MKVYHNEEAMTSSVIDAMLILMRMLKYYQIPDNAPFTSNAIERKRYLIATVERAIDHEFLSVSLTSLYVPNNLYLIFYHFYKKRYH